MKKYPRIARLSTLNIVRHQCFDYEFSPFRTDFVGEGGAGKSMIGDLLQLICVGTKAFHSPTKGTGPRQPSTLVLRSEGGGTDVGYAFLNIEKNKEQYVVIGIYLESSGASNMFIVQNGHDFDPNSVLNTFDQKLGVEDFIKDNKILPIAELKNHLLDNRDLTCESWDQTVRYHQLLYNNDILPIDLSINYRTLENYAKIIQAFSRESLDINKSEKLQSFLFGDDKEKELVSRFYAAIEELSEDFKQFEHNRDEIAELKLRQLNLSALLELKKLSEEKHKLYISNAYALCNSEIERLTSKISERLGYYEQATLLLPKLKDELSRKLERIESEITLLNTEWSIAIEERNDWKKKHDQQQEFGKWLESLNVSEEGLEAIYHTHQQSKVRLEKRKLLEEKCILHNADIRILEKLESKNTALQLAEIYKSNETEIDFKRKLLSLNNINEQDSLAKWVLNLGQNLTKEQEGVIRKFHDLNYKTTAPAEQGTKYVPEPLKLIESLQLSGFSETGYWLNLGGVIEHIDTNFEAIFDKGTSAIRSYFENQSVSLKTELDALEKTQKATAKMQAVLDELDNPDTFIEAWREEIQLSDQLEVLPLHKMEYSEFKLFRESYANRLNIAEKLDESQRKFDRLDCNRRNLNTLQDNLERRFSTFQTIVEPQEISSLKLRFKITSNNSKNFDDILAALDLSEDYYATFDEFYTTEINCISHAHQVVQLDKELESIQLTRNSVYIQDPEWLDTQTDAILLDREQVDKLEENYKNSLQEYIIKYNTLCNTFLKEKAKRFENTGDFQGLCYEVLPSEIVNETTLENEIIEKIDIYLREINLKNKKLNHRKLLKLQDVIEKVQQEVSDQIYNVNFIRRFLNEEDKIITGDLKVVLDFKAPLFNHEWMSVFLDSIGKDLELGGEDTLFDSLKTISNDLEKYPTLQEKLRESFYKSGGSRSLKPKVEELLNPKSYYGLKFAIRNKEGLKNDGSTSQAYSAIALLCMAKLRLIDYSQNRGKDKGAIRFMAIDEAEGLGSNFDMLYKLALDNDYQILSLSINPNKVDLKNQYIYLLQNSRENTNINYDPIPIFGLTNV
ncbi:DNA repair protein Rad50 [Flavobacterium coralii]|uniref:DNA repair protein Rad50 n=1 Tax=Flavobacterium coralii TaxID=2838017 RepID=UPI000C5859CE|nr:DNA repair protein Rad50 [Flavobacterium sp.]|tara:strand:+ start:3101 stop:6328 length:3228 start_codon:yes stop_codon:yes gene_type:complete